MTIEEKRKAIEEYCDGRMCREPDYCPLYAVFPDNALCFRSRDEALIEKGYEILFGKHTIKDSGDRTEFQSGAVRDMHEGKGRFDLLPMCVLMRLAKHYEAGARKYAERNWEQGIPCHSFADSAMRHLVKYMDGYTDEDHLIAAIWNLCGLAWTEEKKPELMDIPARKGGDR